MGREQTGVPEWTDILSFKNRGKKSKGKSKKNATSFYKPGNKQTVKTYQREIPDWDFLIK